MSKALRCRLAFAYLLVVGWSALASSSQCDELAKPFANTAYSVRVDTSAEIRKLTPDFFGFNVEWVEFQLSLWNSADQRVDKDLVEWLKAFPGAVYRYPGGTVANYFDWREATGKISRRRPQRAVKWRDALTVEFGLHEYLEFVSAVGGQAWYVLNLYGAMDGELSPAAMGKEAADAATYFRQERLAGRPAIHRWELGNELDRDRFLWRPEKYADVAKLVMSSVLASDGSAQFVAMSQDWNASKEKYGIDSVTYNTILGNALKGRVTEFASHHYYDGRPWGPPIPAQLRQHCRNLDAIERAGVRSPGIWITEHGRTPKGTPADTDWKKNWPQSADLSAAISVADMAISAARDPKIKGQFLHALHATDGPWPLFHRNRDGRLVPSAVYWGLRTLREGMHPDVLATSVRSADRSGYEGGYEIRAVAQASADRSQLSVWLVNRAANSVQISLQVPSLANVAASASMTMLDNSDPSISNYGGVTRIRPRTASKVLEFNRDGQAILDIPASAVMSVSLSGLGEKK